MNQHQTTNEPPSDHPALRSWLIAPLPPTKSGWKGWAWTLLVAFVLPISSLWFLTVSSVLGVRLLYTRIRRSTEKYGSDTALHFDVLTALVVIPLLALFSTVGTGIAFYSLTIAKREGSSWMATGWTILGSTVLFTVVLVIAFARILSRHKSGVEVLAFEQDVNPRDALMMLYDFRTKPAVGFLPGIVHWSAEAASEALGNNCSKIRLSSPTFSQTIRKLWEDKEDRKQYFMLCIGAILWWLIPFTISERYRWWRFLLLLVALTMIAISAVLTAKSTFYDYLLWGRRAERLFERYQEGLRDVPQVTDLAGQQGTRALDKTLEDLQVQVSKLAEEVRLLRERDPRLYAKLSLSESLRYFIQKFRFD